MDKILIFIGVLWQTVLGRQGYSRSGQEAVFINRAYEMIVMRRVYGRIRQKTGGKR